MTCCTYWCAVLEFFQVDLSFNLHFVFFFVSHGLLKAWFNFQSLKISPFVLFLSSNLILLHMEKILGMISILKNLLRLLLWLSILSLQKNVTCLLEKNVLFHCYWFEFSIETGWSCLMVLLKSSASLILYDYMFNQLLMRHNCWIVYFSFQFSQFLLPKCWDPIIKSIFIYL